MTGSTESANKSILQVSSFHSASSLATLKGKATLPQIHIMWRAFWLTTLPCGSRTTRMGFFRKSHFSLAYLITAGSIAEGWCTENHGIIYWRASNLLSFAAVHGVDLSIIGSHTTSY